MFLQYWTKPDGGFSTYLHRFLSSGDPTFQHIATWTLLQLLESEDSRLLDLISKADDIIQMVRSIAEKMVESDDEDSEDGEQEVVALARRCLELLGKSSKTLIEG